jgi:hypothetical protein
MANDAAYYRAHRAAFLLALELGCTPKEAEAKLRQVEARERHRAAADRLAARMNAPLNGRSGTVIIDEFADFERRDSQPWMLRD